MTRTQGIFADLIHTDPRHRRSHRFRSGKVSRRQLIAAYWPAGAPPLPFSMRMARLSPLKTSFVSASPLLVEER